ncbi:MAG TPA: GntR family transcriptional regulator [Burkholderiaceae bacterium]|nr:GntR family transcriptional regulator [Burkholderiaceae bacterium]
MTVEALSLAPEAGVSQTHKAQLRLRELIVSGELAPRQRIAELALVERLGVSRTPIRMALARLQEEGLIEALPGGGFVVCEFSERDIRDAIELRGVLEGLVARLAAERGVSAAAIAAARECLDGIDELLAQPQLTEASFSGYVQLNGRFHDLLAEMADSPVVERQLARAKTLPFASPNGFVFASSLSPRARDSLVVAQSQHRAVIDAIEAREGARAEALMREHARIAHRNLTEALLRQDALDHVPGANLIRRRGPR